ncbi:hypothetical protein [Nostoc sp. CMAA1605]|nr:hypothetical protein [Nostoc sp. CMAA1605]
MQRLYIKKRYQLVMRSLHEISAIRDNLLLNFTPDATKSCLACSLGGLRV